MFRPRLLFSRIACAWLASFWVRDRRIRGRYHPASDHEGGLFNLVEGGIDHHLLNIHHVRHMPFHVRAYDWVCLAVEGVGFSLIGLTPGP